MWVRWGVVRVRCVWRVSTQGWAGFATQPHLLVEVYKRRLVWMSVIHHLPFISLKTAIALLSMSQPKLELFHAQK